MPATPPLTRPAICKTTCWRCATISTKLAEQMREILSARGNAAWQRARSAGSKTAGRDAAGAAREVSDNFVGVVDESLKERPYTTLGDRRRPRLSVRIDVAALIGAARGEEPSQMLKSIAHEIALSIQARNGLNPAVIVWTAVIAIAALCRFRVPLRRRLCWLSLRFDSVIAGLIMAGIFVVIALIAAVIAALIRQRVRERAILARAAKAHAPSWLLDPKILGVAVEAGRTIGWQRIVPVAVVGFRRRAMEREVRSQAAAARAHRTNKQP